MATYHTEGIIKDIELTQTDGTFTIEATPPYLIDEKNSDMKEKSLLFVEDADGDATLNKGLLCQNVLKTNADENGSAALVKESKELVKESKQILRNAFLMSAKTKFSFACANKMINATTLILMKQNRSKLKVSIKGELVVEGTNKPVPTVLVDTIVIQ